MLELLHVVGIFQVGHVPNLLDGHGLVLVVREVDGTLRTGGDELHVLKLVVGDFPVGDGVRGCLDLVLEGLG